jgi:hypothetical protein
MCDPAWKADALHNRFESNGSRQRSTLLQILCLFSDFTLSHYADVAFTDLASSNDDTNSMKRAATGQEQSQTMLNIPKLQLAQIECNIRYRLVMLADAQPCRALCISECSYFWEVLACTVCVYA